MALPLSTENKIIVGIDFGTTFSGIAWAKVGDDQVNIIQQWPGDNAPNSEKVPTQIVYDKNSEATKWGYQIPSMNKKHHWFKLALDSQNHVQKSAISKRYTDTNAIASDENYSPEQLAVDYLKALKDHLVSTLGRELGNMHAREIPLEFFLTVPAVWSDLAKEKTIAAAKKAGLGDNAPFHMISEPEAAAMYVLHRKTLHKLSVGDTFVVCDAGGGTVDLISYTVTRMDPFIEVKEAAPGSGGLCGSTFINRRFQSFLEFKLGLEPGWDNEVLQDAMNDFELQVKRSYSTTATDQVYAVNVPGLRHNATLGVNKRGKLILKSEEVREILEPVILEVVKLVLDQIKATNAEVKSVLLVGGFGSSQYLQERIRTVVESTVEVIKPPYAWSAVVQGAVIKGLMHNDLKNSSVRLTSRVARKHIGTETQVSFDENIHKESEKYLDPYDGVYKISTMEWYIKKGDAVIEEAPFKFSYYRTHLVSEGRQDHIVEVIYCDSTNRSPVLYRDSQVMKFVELRADISSIPERLIRKREGRDGEMYYHFSYYIEVTYQSASTKYDLVYQGKRCGTVQAEYA